VQLLVKYNIEPSVAFYFYRHIIADDIKVRPQSATSCKPQRCVLAVCIA
jgi:hypothetical protein